MAWEWFGPLATGAVGTVTVTTTVWIARKTLQIQQEQAIRTERRSIYGRFLKAVNTMEDCARRLAVSTGQKDSDDAKIDKLYSDARAEATTALTEIAVVGASEVESRAAEYLNAILRVGLDEDRSEAIRAQALLIDGMKKDLN